MEDLWKATTISNTDGKDYTNFSDADIIHPTLNPILITENRNIEQSSLSTISSFSPPEEKKIKNKNKKRNGNQKKKKKIQTVSKQYPTEKK